jgi:hypothetical protein
MNIIIKGRCFNDSWFKIENLMPRESSLDMNDKRLPEITGESIFMKKKRAIC